MTDAELDDVLSSIDLELSIQRANIALNNCQSYLRDQTPERKPPSVEAPSPPPRPREPQFVLAGKTQGKVPTRGADSLTDGQQDVRNIEDEIERLEEMVGDMQREVEAKQNSFKGDMQSLSGRFQDAICIPPMARKF